VSKKKKIIELYHTPSSMTPFFPEKDEHLLREKALNLVRATSRLEAILHPITRKAIASLIEPMNSYYSNLIEGHYTHPLDIEKALKKNYSRDPEKRALQLENEAHVKVHRFIKEQISNGYKDICSEEFLCKIHGLFYKDLPEEFTRVKNLDGKFIKIIPGAIRDTEVQVGKHIAPAATSVKSFISVFEENYKNKTTTDPLKLIIAMAASHHRLAWIHPFTDGNGRVVRLFSEAFSILLGIDGNGLWSISRGLAVHKDGYYAALANADLQRWNDYDGRGNLSDKFLSEFCHFFIDVAIDQVNFMLSLLELDTLNERVEKFVELMASRNELKKESVYILLEALNRGKISRGEMMRLTGKSENVARSIMNDLLEKELLVSENDGLRSAVLVHFPVRYTPYLFPKLYPENIESSLLKK
jgi:Fic family protein